jgi:hypothetical protein
MRVKSIGRSIAYASLLVCLLAAPAWAENVVGPYATRYGAYLCDPGSGWPETGASGCCSAAGTKPSWDCRDNTTGNPHAAVSEATDRRNILLVVSDDQDYCLYGFMAGVCSKRLSNGTLKTCTDESDCLPDHGSCVGSRDLRSCSGNAGMSCATDVDCGGSGNCTGTPPTDAPLRLNELTCRNRQPRRPHRTDSYCTATDGDPKLDRRRLRFDRANAPCSATPRPARPAMSTPRLDAIAKQAAVFPRAYVAGTQCKNSRRTMLHGRYPRHMQYLWENTGRGRAECRRKAAGNNPLGCLIVQDPDSACPLSAPDNICETQHAMGYWLNSARPSCSGGAAQCNLPDVDRG